MQDSPSIQEYRVKSSQNPKKKDIVFEVLDRTSFKVKVNMRKMDGGIYRFEVFDSKTPDSGMSPQMRKCGPISFIDWSSNSNDKRVFKITGGMVEALRTDPKYSTISDGFEMPYWRIRTAVGNYLVRNKESLQFPFNKKFYDLRRDPLGRSHPTKIICECDMGAVLKAHLIMTDKWVILIFN